MSHQQPHNDGTNGEAGGTNGEKGIGTDKSGSRGIEKTDEDRGNFENRPGDILELAPEVRHVWV